MSSGSTRAKTASPTRHRLFNIKQLHREHSLSQSPVLDTSELNVKSLKDELTCSICLEICVRPCTTPCGHSFCRQCLRGAIMYSSRCPKCRDSLVPGFALNVNIVLWNTIQMLFPHTAQSPASPPAATYGTRRGTESDGREASRDHLTAAYHVRAERRSNLGNSRSQIQGTEEQDDAQSDQSAINRAPHAQRRRLRIHSNARVMSSSPTGVYLRGRPVLHRNLGQSLVHEAPVRSINHRNAVSVNRYTHEGSNVDLDTPVHSFESSSPTPDRHHPSLVNSSILGTENRTWLSRHELMSHIDEEAEDEQYDEEAALELQELARQDRQWRQSLTRANHRHEQTLNTTRVTHAHRFGMSQRGGQNFNSFDNDSDVEYVTLQTVDRLEDEPSARRQRVYRVENRNRYRADGSAPVTRRQLLLRRVTSVPVITERPTTTTTTTTTATDEDAETEHETHSVGGEEVNGSNRGYGYANGGGGGGGGNSQTHHEDDGIYSPIAHDYDRQTPRRRNSLRLSGASRMPSRMTAPPMGPGREGRFSGLAQLYDISSQIEAAMNEVERLSLHTGWRRQQQLSGSSPSHQPTTPMTHRSCYQPSEDEEDHIDEELDDHDHDYEDEIEQDEQDGQDDDDGDDDEETIDWNARLHDAVFILDDVDSSSDISQQFDEIQHLSDCVSVDSQDTEWISSFEDL